MLQPSLTTSIEVENAAERLRLGRAEVWLSVAARWSFGLAVLSAPFRLPLFHIENRVASVYWMYTDLQVYPAEIFVLMVLITWGAGLLIRPRRIDRGPVFMFLPLVGLIVAGGFSLIASVDILLSVSHLLRWCLLLGLYLYVVNEITDLRGLVPAIAGSILLQATIGITQVLGRGPVGLAFLGERIVASNSPDLSLVSIPGGSVLRAYGLADHPNILAGVLVITLLLYLTSSLKSGSTVTQPVALAIFSLGFSALLLTFSRSAWAAGSIALVWLAWQLRRGRHLPALRRMGMVLLSGAIVMLPLVISMAPYIRETLFSMQMKEIPRPAGQISSERAALNQAANQIFAGHALTGVGLGAFPIALSQQSPDFAYYFQPPHLTLLEAAAETGIFGAMFYLVLMVAPWLGMWLSRKRLVVTIPLLGASAALLALSVIAWMDYYPWLLVPGLVWQFVLWGLWSRAFSQGLRIQV